MQNILEILKEFGLEIAEDKKQDFNKKVIENYKTVVEHTNKIEKLEGERDKYKGDYETAKATLDGFDGKDFDAITKERDEWKQKAEDSEKDYQDKLSKRDYTDAVNAAVENLKFTSNSAKKAFITELQSDPLKIKDGKLLGFDDYVKSYQESDATAFVTEADDNKAKFTEPLNNSPVQTDKGLADLRSAMGLPTEKK